MKTDKEIIQVKVDNRSGRVVLRPPKLSKTQLEKKTIPFILPEPWRSFWKEIDKVVTEPIEFHCLGGFVITLIYGLERTTSDVDVISVIPRNPVSALIDFAGKGSPLHKKHCVYLDVVGIATVPENYDERLTEVFSGEFGVAMALTGIRHFNH